MLFAAHPVGAVQPMLVHVDVFQVGKEGYHTYRIPSVATAPDGTLIAFAEGRRDNREDPGGGDIDLVYKRSRDNGVSWSPRKILDNPGEGWAASNPTMVVDRRLERVWILYNRWEPGHGTQTSQPGTTNNQSWARYSDDNGESWSEPIDVTRRVREFDQWGSMFFGPGSGIQTRSGRLIVPAAAYSQGSSYSYAVYSDDGGSSWSRGEFVRGIATNENQLVELEDGSILMSARQSVGALRFHALSKDGGSTWSRQVLGQSVTPVAAAVERYASTLGSEARILWTGPRGPGRNVLVVRLSNDDGQSFSLERLISGDQAAYSDLTTLKDSTIGVLWERGEKSEYQFITFSRFNLQFLEQKMDTDGHSVSHVTLRWPPLTTDSRGTQRVLRPPPESRDG